MEEKQEGGKSNQRQRKKRESLRIRRGTGGGEGKSKKENRKVIQNQIRTKTEIKRMGGGRTPEWKRCNLNLREETPTSEASSKGENAADPK